MTTGPSNISRLTVESDLASAKREPRPAIDDGLIALEALATCTELFQPRNITAGALSSEAHISALSRALRNSPDRQLEAMDVWWSGSRWVIINGHHRLHAYYRHYSADLSTRVPVRRFDGELRDAVLFSVESNIRDHLSMSHSDKSQAAWRMVCMGGLSKREIVQKSGTSVGTVAHMRRKKKEIETRGDDPTEYSWAEVLADEQGRRTYTDDDRQAEVQKIVQGLGKVFTKRIVSRADLVAEALDQFSPQLVRQLALSDQFQEAVMDERDRRQAELMAEGDLPF